MLSLCPKKVEIYRNIAAMTCLKLEEERLVSFLTSSNKSCMIITSSRALILSFWQRLLVVCSTTYDWRVFCNTTYNSTQSTTPLQFRFRRQLVQQCQCQWLLVPWLLLCFTQTRLERGGISICSTYLLSVKCPIFLDLGGIIYPRRGVETSASEIGPCQKVV